MIPASSFDAEVEIRRILSAEGELLKCYRDPGLTGNTPNLHRDGDRIATLDAARNTDIYLHQASYFARRATSIFKLGG